MNEDLAKTLLDNAIRRAIQDYGKKLDAQTVAMILEDITYEYINKDK